MTHNHLRIQAAIAAEKSNALYRKSCEVHLDYIYFKSAKEIMSRFATRYNVGLFSVLYILLLATDTIFSATLIKPIAWDILQMQSVFGFILTAVLYAILILVLTLNASKNYYKSSRKNLDLDLELEQLKNNTKSGLELKENILKDIKGKRILGFFWIFSLIALTVLLALLRSYLNSEHQVYNFEKPIDWVTLLLPLLLVIALVYLGQYKSHLLKLWGFRSKEQYLLKQREQLYQRSFNEMLKAFEFNNRADNANEKPIQSKELCTCLDRLENKSNIDGDFFEFKRENEVVIVLFEKGEPLKQGSIDATTGENNMVYTMTDEVGQAQIKWKSELNYLVGIRINRKVLPGSYFVTGDRIEFDLANLEGETN